jgi:hypothetical protein
MPYNANQGIVLLVRPQWEFFVFLMFLFIFIIFIFGFGMKVVPQGHELEVLKISDPQDLALLGILCRRLPIALSI